MASATLKVPPRLPMSVGVPSLSQSTACAPAGFPGGKEVFEPGITTPEWPCEAFFGNAGEATQYAAAALEVAKGRDVEYGAVFALALAGDTARSQALARDLERASEDTYVRFNYLPTLRALWAVKRGDASAAIEALEMARPYDLAVSGSGLDLATCIRCTYVGRRIC